jgi:acyl carrier protein phosphodiesterase
MNFLSHFYFDRYATDPYHVLGTVLPDLLKNADKTYNIHPEKLPEHPDKAVNCIIEGWKRHLEVDKYFHSSEFFAHHSHQLKLVLAPAIQGSVVKPFFLGHIALELILDNLLITTGKLNVDDFYVHLDKVETDKLELFFNYSGLENPERFFKFFSDFKRHRYLHTYSETPQIAYALKRICMRIWKDPFTPEQEENMTEVLLKYRLILAEDHMHIFNDIDAFLK